MKRAQIAALTAASLIVGAGYYTVADVLELVPGPLTAAAADITVNPFPSLDAGKDPLPTVQGVNSDAKLPDTSALNALVAGLTSDANGTGAATGVSIIDVATGKELVDSNAQTGLTPASSTKILTAWAALSSLGADHRLSTNAVLSGTTVTLVGGGDVLLSPDGGNAQSTEGHAGLGDLARATASALSNQGISRVSVALDDTLFTGGPYSPGWTDDDHSWVAPIQPIMINVGSDGAGGFQTDPAIIAAQTFATHLTEAGITVDGDVIRAAAPADATKLASVSSAPLEDILRKSLKESDNTMTEVEGKMVAHAVGESTDFPGATRAILKTLAKDGFDTTGVALLDSSGLSAQGKIPAHFLAQIIARAAGDDGGTVGRTLLSDLPVAGLDGTLMNRFVGMQAAGHVRAKTGSLDQSTSMSGMVLTADGRLLAFGVIVDGFAEGGLTTAHDMIDNDLISRLADCGCSTAG